jgi:hypothetical protein
LVCWMSPKQVWSWYLVAAAALLFSQCNMAWRSFLWARGSGCRRFDSPLCFISARCGFSISARFLIHTVHAVCFCTLVTILGPPMYCIFFIHSSIDVDGYPGWFYFLAIVSSDSINLLQIHLWHSDCISFAYIHCNGVIGS